MVILKFSQGQRSVGVVISYNNVKIQKRFHHTLCHRIISNLNVKSIKFTPISVQILSRYMNNRDIDTIYNVYTRYSNSKQKTIPPKNGVSSKN